MLDPAGGEFSDSRTAAHVSSWVRGDGKRLMRECGANRNYDPMKIKNILLALCFVAVIAAYPSHASVITSYSFNLDPGTSNGQDITNIMIFEADAGGQLFMDYGGTPSGFTTSGSGLLELSHTSAFAPTTSLIIGLTQGVDKTQVVMFVNDSFAASATGFPFSESFSTTRHNELINHLLLAESGDQSELDWFANIFFPTDGTAAAFATGGSFTAMEFSNGDPIGNGVPEQSDTALLLGISLGMVLVGRWWTCRRKLPQA